MVEIVCRNIAISTAKARHRELLISNFAMAPAQSLSRYQCWLIVGSSRLILQQSTRLDLETQLEIDSHHFLISPSYKSQFLYQ